MDTSVVTPNVDFSKVEAINQKRTLAFINHWVLHTVAFLNQFSAMCEERLIALDTKLRRADHSLAILEAKLSSVPDLEGVVAPAAGNTQEAPSGTTTTTTATAVATASPSGENLAASPKEDEATPNATPPKDSTAEPEGEDVVDEKVAQPATKPICEDPRFAQYFRMLKMGVPDPAIRMKMSSEGVDPSLLE
ncbi:WASH complex subunit CCDC53 [Portunus trituberculatus]|uniref:WASH complex subunit CCDC53 n=1 Tax=Portunus trituberculatus TaxID=210409 RepID=A0A5B7D3W6_PORTR|nr:WASH complex subunit CCDC53 [Portunus trituberculatus]